MSLEIEFDREDDGRWIADIPALPGVMAYGSTRDQASMNVRSLAVRVIADRIEHGIAVPDSPDFFVEAVAAREEIGPKALYKIVNTDLDQNDH